MVAVISADGREFNIVIEVKGLEWPLDEIKYNWANHWVKAVNAHDTYGLKSGKIWGYLYLDSEEQARNVDDCIRDFIKNY